MVATCTIGAAFRADAQNEQATAALAKQAQNPVANMVSLPFQNNANFNVGSLNRNQNTMNIQPVIPIGLGPVNLITRTIVPVLYRPDLSSTSGANSGLGDINASFFFSPSAPGRVTWGVGPAVYFPTATDENLGSGRWSAGPTVVALTMPGNWLVGALVSNVWSFAGDSEEADVNSLVLQYFVNYNLPNQWYISSAPIVTANWNAEEGNKWVVPFGGGIGKIFNIGGQPVNGQVQAFWNAIHPDIVVDQAPVGGLPPGASEGASWTLRLQLQLLFPR